MITRVDFSEAGQFRRRAATLSPADQRAEVATYRRWLQSPGLGIKRRRTYQLRVRVLSALLSEGSDCE